MRNILAAALLLLAGPALAQVPAGGHMIPGNNLSDVPSPPAARSNLNNVGDGINVADYGLIADGEDGCYSSVTLNSGSSGVITLGGSAYSVTTTANSNVVTMTGGNAPFVQTTNIGQHIYFATLGAGGTPWVDTIANVTVSGVTGSSIITLADVPPTVVTTTSMIVVFPAFTAADAGKTIWVSQGAASIDGLFQHEGPLLTTIASYTDPLDVVMSSTTGAAFALRSGICLKWGTNNHTAIVNARAAAIATNQRFLNFESKQVGGSPLVIATGWNMTQNGADTDTIGNGLFRSSSGVRGFFADNTAIPLNKVIGARDPGETHISAPARTMNVGAQWPRFDSHQTVNICTIGDSMAVDKIVQSGTWSQPTRVIDHLTAANPNKTIVSGNVAIGGTTWFQYYSLPFSTSPPSSAGSQPSWYANHAQEWGTYASGATSNTGCPFNPDVVLLYWNGGNDGQAMDVENIEAIINDIRTNYPKDSAGLPPDIGMVNLRPFPMAGNAPQGTTDTGQIGREAGATTIYTVARDNNIAMLDYFDWGSRARDGWSPRRLELYGVPKPQTVTPVFNLPQGTGYYVRDFDYNLFLNYANGAAAAAAVPKWSVQIGQRPGNEFEFGTDGSGYLTVEGRTWGQRVTSNVTITTGTTPTLTMNSAVTTSAITTVHWTTDMWSDTSTITLTGATPFTTGSVGQGIIIEGGNCIANAVGPTGLCDFRGQIVAFKGVSSVVVSGFPMMNGSTGLSGATIITGPNLFRWMDLPAAANVQVDGAGPGGATLFCTVASYSSETSVGLNCPAGSAGLTSTSEKVWIGHDFLLEHSTTIQLTAGLGANPSMEFGITGNNGGEAYINFAPYSQAYTGSQTVSITSGSCPGSGIGDTVTTSAAFFYAGMQGLPLTIPGETWASPNGTHVSNIQSVTDSTHAVMSDCAGNSLSSSAQTVVLGPQGATPASIVYRGPIERSGGLFDPLISTTAGTAVSIGFLGLDNEFVGVPLPNAPWMSDTEMWGTQDADYAFGGTGIGHTGALQADRLDEEVLNSQEFAAPPVTQSQSGSATPTTGTTVTIPANQAFTAITPAGTLAALTVVLPSVMPLNGTPVQFTISQIITSLTINAPGGYTISGPAVGGATTTAGATYAYRLSGTVWYRVQ